MNDLIITLYQSGKSSRTIARELNSSHSQVLKHLKENGIRRRSITESAKLRTKKLTYSDKIREVIDGLTLGDGSIKSQSGLSGNIVIANKSGQFIRYVKQLLDECNIANRIYVSKKGYTYLESLSYDLLFDEYSRWYPDGKKIIPKDIKLSPLNVTLWYLGDGTISGVKYDRTGMICYRAKFCTNGFTISDVDFLVNLLEEKGIRCYRQVEKGKYPLINIGAKNIQSLYSYMLPCPVGELAYRWPIPQSKSLTARQELAVNYRRMGYTPKQTAKAMSITPVAVHYLLGNAQRLLKNDPIFAKMKPGPKRFKME